VLSVLGSVRPPEPRRVSWRMRSLRRT